MLNCSFTKQEIISCRGKLKSSKASGLDMIKNEVVKSCLEDNKFLDALRLLIDKIFREGRYPQK